MIVQVVREHRRPRDGLQQHPMRSERDRQPNNNDNFSEPDEHEGTLGC
jgi:hypothetical protein